MNYRERARWRNAVKEAFDNLPAGICYFDKMGIPILTNYTMDRLAYELMGQDLQYEEEIRSAVDALPDLVFTDSTGNIWKFQRNVEASYGTEYIATNITEIHQETEILREKNKNLEKIKQAMEESRHNIDAIAREEEVLSMKMLIHNKVGSSILSLQKYYRNNSPAEGKPELLAKLRDMASTLKGEAGQGPQGDLLSDLKNTAEAIGTEIHISGPLPEDPELLALTVSALRECMTNTLKHADGDAIFAEVQGLSSPDTAAPMEKGASPEGTVTSENTAPPVKGYSLTITNNGKPPEGPIVEGGGLSSLRRKIEQAGGRMDTTWTPAFQLHITFAEKGATSS